VGRWRTTDYLRKGLISPLRQVIQSQIRFHNTPSNISWPPNIYCTKNFTNSLANSKMKGMNNYLRPVDALLCVERMLSHLGEGRKLLPHFWEGSQVRVGHRVQLMNLALLEGRGPSRVNPIPLALRIGPTPSSSSSSSSSVVVVVDDLSILALRVQWRTHLS
jgi:hypothetical protein